MDENVTDAEIMRWSSNNAFPRFSAHEHHASDDVVLIFAHLFNKWRMTGQIFVKFGMGVRPLLIYEDLHVLISYSWFYQWMLNAMRILTVVMWDDDAIAYEPFAQAQY
jgi:hypothetical protein